MLTSPTTAETIPGTTPDADAVSAAQGRRLDEDVLQSAEDAVLSNPDAAAVLVETPTGILSRYEAALTGYVARRPLQSALIAIAAGAVTAALVRSALHTRQSRRGP